MSDHKTSTQIIRSEAVDQAIKMLSVSPAPLAAEEVVRAANVIAAFVVGSSVPPERPAPRV